MIKGMHIDRDGKSGRADSGKRSRGLCVNVRTKERSSQRGAAWAGRAPQSPQPGEETETHCRPECCMRTENSQLPHWLVVRVEEDSHGDQGVVAVSLAESMEVCKEAGPLQEGLKEKRRAGMRATAGTPLSPPPKMLMKSFFAPSPGTCTP